MSTLSWFIGPWPPLSARCHCPYHNRTDGHSQGNDPWQCISIWSIHWTPSLPYSYLSSFPNNIEVVIQTWHLPLTPLKFDPELGSLPELGWVSVPVSVGFAILHTRVWNQWLPQVLCQNTSDQDVRAHSTDISSFKIKQSNCHLRHCSIASLTSTFIFIFKPTP